MQGTGTQGSDGGAAMKRSNLICNLIAIPGLAFILVRYALLHGDTWEFGSPGMPAPLIEGLRYKDGDMVDPMTFSLHEQGLHQLAMWGCAIFATVMLLYSRRLR